MDATRSTIGNAVRPTLPAPGGGRITAWVIRAFPRTARGDGARGEETLAVTDDPSNGPRRAPASAVAVDEHRARFERALARARRHSRVVRVLRLSLPVLAVLTVLGFAAAVWVRAVVPENLALDGLTVEDGELVMTNPRLRGFDERDQPYSVDAERATQSVSNPERFRLERVDADVPMSDGRRVAIASDGATYDRDADLLVIPDAFTITVDDGTEAALEGGTVDIGAGTFESSGAVSITRPDASIAADALSIDQNAQSATFTGRVRVTIEPGSRNAPPTLRGDPADPKTVSDRTRSSETVQ